MDANKDPLDFYRQHGLMTDPRTQVSLFSDLPGDIPSLCKVVQGLLLHEGWAGQYGVTMSEERGFESGIRPVADKLTRILELDDRSLAEPRGPSDRLFSTCRDFALLLTAMLRHKGIPARVRFGFATYFWPQKPPQDFADHVITEYWQEADQKWVLVDPQLDELQCNAIGATFDPCNIPRNIYLTGDVAWQRCQQGEVDPGRFGFLPQYTGLWYVKGHLARDLAAQNKVEMLCWDYWGLFERRDSELSTGELDLLNRAAALSLAGNQVFGELRSLYQRDMRLRVPPVVKSWYVEDKDEYRLDDILGSKLSLAKFL